MAIDVTITATTADETRDVGRRLGVLLRAGDLVVLAGDLGTGKTTLTQGIGEVLGVRGAVTSPTFVLSRVHPSVVRGGPALVHVDAYRLGGRLEVDDLDLDTDLAGAVMVVEWGSGLVEGLAEDRLEVLITRPDDDDTAGADGVRTVSVRGVGSRWSGVDLRNALPNPV